MKQIIIAKAGSTFDEIKREYGDFEQWIVTGMGLSFGTVTVVDAASVSAWPDPQSCGAVVVTGSHAMVTDGHAWSEALAVWLRALVVHATPVLGICYGHQLLTHALGGVVNMLHGGPEIGTVGVELCDAAHTDPLFRDVAVQFDAQAMHWQSVRVAAPGATILARSERDPYHAVRYGDCAWGVQFHPEFSSDVTRGYLRQQRDKLAAIKVDADALASAVKATPIAATILRRFALFSGVV